MRNSNKGILDGQQAKSMKFFFEGTNSNWFLFGKVLLKSHDFNMRIHQKLCLPGLYLIFCFRIFCVEGLLALLLSHMCYFWGHLKFIYILYTYLVSSVCFAELSKLNYFFYLFS